MWLKPRRDLFPFLDVLEISGGCKYIAQWEVDIKKIKIHTYDVHLSSLGSKRP